MVIRRRRPSTLEMLSSHTDIDSIELRYPKKYADISKSQKAWLRLSLPIFAQPLVDISKGYGLVGTFVKFEGNACHIRVIYEGESTYNRYDPYKENRFGAFLYRSFNYLQYRRTADINQLCIDFDEPSGSNKNIWNSIWSVDGSGIQSWNRGTKRDCCFVYSLMHHYDFEIDFEDWEKESSRPIVYLNTGNHLMGSTDLNPQMDKRLWREYPVWYGGLREAELYAQTQVRHRCGLCSCFRIPFCCCMRSLQPPRVPVNAFQQIDVWDITFH